MQDLVVVAVVCSPNTPRGLADQVVVALNSVNHASSNVEQSASPVSLVVEEAGQFHASIWNEREEIDDAVEVVIDLSWPQSLDGDHVRSCERIEQRLSELRQSVKRYIFLSSGFVYGPRDLVKDADGNDLAIELDDDTELAVELPFESLENLARVERYIDHVAKERSEISFTVVRPCVVVDADQSAWLFEELAGLVAAPDESVERRVQYLASEDLVSALVHVVSHSMGGAVNVSPQGSIEVREARAIAGDVPSMSLPPALARVAEMPGRVAGIFRTTPDLGIYAQQGTVLSSARLAASGWKASCSSEEALVASVRGSWWSQLSPKRRQELALGVAAFSVVGVAGAIALALLRRRRH